MKTDIIYLPDVAFDKLKAIVDKAIGKLPNGKILVSKRIKSDEFLLSFPRGISNENFVRLFTGLMSPDWTKSKELCGWFWSTEKTLKNGNGSAPRKRIMLTPYGENGNAGRHGVIEDGREIHFGSDGTVKILDDGNLRYTEPYIDPDEFELLFTAENKTMNGNGNGTAKNGQSNDGQQAEQGGGLLAKLKNMFK